MAKNKITIVQMVKSALEELGPDAKPLAIQDNIKTKYGKELSTTIISNYKSVMKKKAEEGGEKKKGGPGRPPKSASAGSIAIQDIEELKKLVEKMGAGSVKALLSFMS
jgi:hypothetical protein